MSKKSAVIVLAACIALIAGLMVAIAAIGGGGFSFSGLFGAGKDIDESAALNLEGITEVSVYCPSGDIIISAGEPGAAIQAYREALRLRPDIARFHYALAAAQAAHGEAEAAAATLAQAHKLGPDEPLPLTAHGRRL